MVLYIVFYLNNAAETQGSLGDAICLQVTSSARWYRIQTCFIAVKERSQCNAPSLQTVFSPSVFVGIHSSKVNSFKIDCSFQFPPVVQRYAVNQQEIKNV